MGAPTIQLLCDHYLLFPYFIIYRIYFIVYRNFGHVKGVRWQRRSGEVEVQRRRTGLTPIFL